MGNHRQFLTGHQLANMLIKYTLVNIILLTPLEASPALSGQSLASEFKNLHELRTPYAPQYQQYQQQQGRNLQDEVEALQQQSDQYAAEHKYWALSRVLIPPPPPSPSEEEIALARTYFEEPQFLPLPELTQGETFRGPSLPADKYYYSQYPQFQPSALTEEDADKYFHSQYPQFQPTAGKEDNADLYYNLPNQREEADQYLIQYIPANPQTTYDNVDDTENMIFDFPKHLLKAKQTKYLY